MAYLVGEAKTYNVLTPAEQDRKALVDLEQEQTARKRLQAEQMAAKRQQWLSQALQQYRHEDGTPDLITIAKQATAFDPEFGLDLQDRVNKTLKGAADSREVELKNEAAEFKLGLDALNNITDESSFAIYLPKIQRLSPELAASLGEQFDPQRIEDIRFRGLSEKDRLDRHAALIKNAQTADDYLAGVLSEAQSQEDVDDAFAGAPAFGADATSLAALKAKYGTQFAPGYAERVAKLAIPAAKEADLASQAAGQAVTMRGQDIGAATARRGQDIAAATARRGQDLSAAGGEGGGDLDKLADTIVKNPSVYDGLTPTVKQKLIVRLAERGFDFTSAGPNVVGDVIGKLEGLSSKINTSSGGMSALISGALRSGAAKAQHDNDVALYNSLVKGMIPLVARKMGHTGVLTQQDVDSTRELFPYSWDNKTLAQRKLAAIKEIAGGGAAAKDTKKKDDPLGIRK